MRSGNYTPPGEVPHFPDEEPNAVRTTVVVAVVMASSLLLSSLGVGGSEASSQTDQPSVTNEVPTVVDHQDN